MTIIDIWIALLGLAVILYVILDGFGLGIGLLFPFTRDEDERDTYMNSIAPVWDANQTWLVFGGGTLLVAFPLMYGVLCSALYVPLFTLLYGLIFRGVSFEFRMSSESKHIWDRAFFVGSFSAVAAQGLILGGILTGTKIAGGHFSGNAFDWFNAYSIATAAGLISGYVLLASTYLIIKTTGAVQDRAYGTALRSSVVVLVFQAGMITWTPFHYPEIMDNWLAPPRVYFIWMFPALGLLAFAGIIKSLIARREVMPFLFSVVFFFAGYLGLFASIYPYAVPPDITFYDAAAQRETLAFTLWGAAIMLPAVMGYTIYNYAVFRGKVGKEGYYH
jgi:cytochrome d ubiquinol oxidase subunit II